MKRLSNLEKQALALVLAGKTNREIAAEIGTEEHCVKNRVRSALQKLGLKHCRQLLAHYQEAFHVTQTLE